MAARTTTEHICANCLEDVTPTWNESMAHDEIGWRHVNDNTTCPRVRPIKREGSI